MLLCRQLDLFGRELLAVDGTRIKAVNNKDRNLTRASLTQFIKAADVKLENEAVLDRMQARIAQRPDILDQRRETVEHPFGTIKQCMNQGAFLMRGLEKVRAEFSLRRVLNIVGLPKLIAALPALKTVP